MKENWKRIPPALQRGTGKSENSRAGIFPTGVASSVAKVRSREWQKFRLGLVPHRGIIGSTGSSGRLHRYRRVDDGTAIFRRASRRDALEGYFLSFLFLPLGRVHRNVFQRFRP